MILTTYNKKILDFVYSDGSLNQNKIEINLSSLNECNFDQEDENNGDYFAYSGKNFISYTPPDYNELANSLSTIQEVNDAFSNLVNGASTSADTLNEISNYFRNDPDYLKDQIIPFVRRQKMIVFRGDGNKRLFEFDHISGNVDVFINGIKKIPKVIDFTDINGDSNLDDEFDYQSIGRYGSPLRLNFTTDHTDPDYGIHWRTNYTEATGETRRLVDYYSLYIFNFQQIPSSIESFIDNLEEDEYFLLDFTDNIEESNQFDPTNQKLNYSYVTQYLGSELLDMPVEPDEMVPPGFRSLLFTNGPRGQIGSPYYVDFYNLEPVNAQRNSSAIEFLVAPNLNDVILIRSY